MADEPIAFLVGAAVGEVIAGIVLGILLIITIFLVTFCVVRGDIACSCCKIVKEKELDAYAA